MTQTITEDEYIREVENSAGRLIEGSRDSTSTPMEYALDYVSDELDGHDWFNEPQFGPSEHGTIIEFSLDRDVEVERFTDWWSVSEADGVRETVSRLAYCMMEADVLSVVEDHFGKSTGRSDPDG